MPRLKKAKPAVTKEEKAKAKNEPDMQFIGSSEEGVLRSLASRKKLRNKVDSEVSRKKLRNKVDSEVENFLNSGGAINKIEANVMADPPRKPTSNYGSRPI